MQPKQLRLIAGTDKTGFPLFLTVPDESNQHVIPVTGTLDEFRATLPEKLLEAFDMWYNNVDVNPGVSPEEAQSLFALQSDVFQKDTTDETEQGMSNTLSLILTCAQAAAEGVTPKGNTLTDYGKSLMAHFAAADKAVDDANAAAAAEEAKKTKDQKAPVVPTNNKPADAKPVAESTKPTIVTPNQPTQATTVEMGEFLKVGKTLLETHRNLATAQAAITTAQDTNLRAIETMLNLPQPAPALEETTA